MSTRCFYCGKLANSKDHLPSKVLLEKPYPPNLLSIPSCIICNRSFSLDEEYLLNVLVEISDNPNLRRKKDAGGTVYRARERSPGLAKRIMDSFISGENGKIYFRPQAERMKRVIEKIALGLFFYKYGIPIPLSRINCTGFYSISNQNEWPAEIFMLTINSKFRPKRWHVIQKDVFHFIIVKNWMRNNNLSMIVNLHHAIWFTIDIPSPFKLKPSSVSSNQLSLFKHN
jgi:hypothetical protein